MLNTSIGHRLAGVSAALLLLASAGNVRAETSFPQEIDSAAGKITFYQPQPRGDEPETERPGREAGQRVAARGRGPQALKDR